MRTALLVLLLSAVGMGKGYAQEYDFSAVCETGQTLYYNIIGTNQVEMTSPTGMGWYGFEEPTGDIVLPESVQFEGTNYTVTSIGSYAFMYCRELTGSLAIPNSVTTIGFLAFSSCTGLTSLFIPQSVTSIGFDIYTYSTSSFPGCGFEQIIVDLNNPVYDSRDNCNAIIETSTNTLIQGCNNSFIPASVTIIGSDAFSGCIGLTSIDIPDSVTIIGSGAFSGCIGLTSIDIPFSVTVINNHTFGGCTGLTSISIPNSITEIGLFAFSYCTGLTGDLFIPNSVTVIGRGAFEYCSGLTSVFIPQSVECFDSSYGDVPFAFCTALESIIIDANNPYFDSRDNCNAIIKTSTNQLIQGCKNSIIPNSITTIGAGAFLGCTGLSGGILIPDAVTGIGRAAFYGCSSITSLTIGNSVTLISHDVFAECTNLASVTVLAVTPPYFCDGSEKDAFSGVPCTTLTVPCHCIEAYAAEGWDYHFTTIVDDCTSVAEEEENRGFVYPNPTSGQVKIEAEDLKQITISDMLGQIIYESKAEGDVFEYDFSNNEAGVYLVRIETASGIVVKKVSVTQ